MRWSFVVWGCVVLSSLVRAQNIQVDSTESNVTTTQTTQGQQAGAAQGQVTTTTAATVQDEQQASVEDPILGSMKGYLWNKKTITYDSEDKKLAGTILRDLTHQTLVTQCAWWMYRTPNAKAFNFNKDLNKCEILGESDETHPSKLSTATGWQFIRAGTFIIEEVS